MEIILYTDTDKIRSALGVDDADLPDNQITDRGLDKELRLDLVSWLPTHSDIENTGTTDQVDALELYSTYFCAVSIAPTLQISAPQKLTDGKDALDRFANIDWKALLDSLREKLAFYKSLLNTSINSTTTINSFTLFSAAGLSADPVTS